MMLSSVEFQLLIVVIGLLPAFVWWCERKRGAQQEVLFACAPSCAHEVVGTQLVLMDELYAEVVEQQGETFILRVSDDLMWLAAIYVTDGVLTPVVKK